MPVWVDEAEIIFFGEECCLPGYIKGAALATVHLPACLAVFLFVAGKSVHAAFVVVKINGGNAIAPCACYLVGNVSYAQPAQCFGQQGIHLAIEPRKSRLRVLIGADAV